MKNVNKRALFFDFDGTLWFGKIGEKTLEALKEAHAQGDLLFLCTGRSRGNFDMAWIDGIPFDGMLFGGCNAETNGKELFLSTLTREQVEETIKITKKYHLDILWEGYYNNYRAPSTSNIFDNNMRILEDVELLDVEKYPVMKMDIIKPFKNGAYIPVPQPAKDDLAKMYLLNEFDSYLELLQKGLGKDEMIKLIKNEYGISSKNCYAFGDSNNDIAMKNECDTLIAINHAPEGLKKIAEYVTQKEENGVAEAIEYLNLKANKPTF